jgi:xylan 1,4-beta-xylosidase
MVDKEHGSPLPAYEKMGRPASPTTAQIEALRKAAALPRAEVRALKDGGLTLTLQPHSLALVEVAK